MEIIIICLSMSYLKVGTTTYTMPAHEKLSMKNVEGPRVWSDFMTSRSILFTLYKEAWKCRVSSRC